MKIGILGLDQSGKKTIFESVIQTTLTPDGNLEDRLATITVPDERIDWLSSLYRPRKTTYAAVTYQLPGMRTRQGKKDEGLAWASLRDCDALIHIVRNFSLHGLPAPSLEESFLELERELIFADLLVVEKRLERLEADMSRNREVNREEMDQLLRCRVLLEEELPLRRDRELASSPLLKGYAFLTARPCLVVLNNEDDSPEPPQLGGRLTEETMLVIRGRLEREIALLSAEERTEFLNEYGIGDIAVDRLIRASYRLLGLISFFTVGEDEVRAWTIREGDSALEAAEAIHSDIRKGFIRAETVSWADLEGAGSYAEARRLGKVRLEGKTYTVKDGDIMDFRFNV